MAHTDSHAPRFVQEARLGVATVSIAWDGEMHTDTTLPWHEIMRVCPPDSVARGIIRRTYNRRERHEARRALRTGDYDRLAPRWSPPGQVAWDLT